MVRLHPVLHADKNWQAVHGESPKNPVMMFGRNKNQPGRAATGKPDLKAHGFSGKPACSCLCYWRWITLGKKKCLR
jgi:hypothetical protein